jgi:hypothetical protein
VIEQPFWPNSAIFYVNERYARKRSGITIAQYIGNIRFALNLGTGVSLKVWPVGWSVKDHCSSLNRPYWESKLPSAAPLVGEGKLVVVAPFARGSTLKSCRSVRSSWARVKPGVSEYHSDTPANNEVRKGDILVYGVVMHTFPTPAASSP